MGFIERLRQQKETAFAAMQSRYAQEAVRAQAAASKQQQRAAEERELHRKRRQQAETHFQESGIEPLIAELAKITGEYSYGFHTWGRLDWGRLSGLDHGWFATYKQVPDLATDPDSVSIGFVWDDKKIGSGDAELKDSSRREKWDIFEGKYFGVESHPDGNIIFHAKRDITVPEPKWKNSKDILEGALEQAYNNPRVQKFNGARIEYYRDIGD